MRGSTTLRFFTTLATLATLACGGGGGNNNGGNNNPTGPGGTGATNGSFTALVNGVTWSAIGTVAVSRQQNNFIGIAASGYAGSTNYAFVIGIANATGPGTHSFVVTAGGDGSSLIIGGQVTGWGTAFNGGTGSVTITSLSSNRVVGTFSGIAVPSSGTAANLVVTNGAFDITF
jgi:hypothetical protein